MELETHVRRFEEAEESSHAARNEARLARRYYDGNQLTDAEKEEIRKSGQMPGVFNRIRRKIDWLAGLELQSRTDPKAFPRTPKHEQGANAATDAIRYVADKEDFDKKRSRVWEGMLIEGLGGVEIIHDFRPPMRNPQVRINCYPADRIFYDPHSVEPDFSDARYLGAVIWSDADELAREHPDAADAIMSSVSENSISDDYEDKPMWRVWSDPKRRRVRMVLMHYREGGQWKWVQFVRGGIIAEGDSEYVDEDGESLCPMELVSAYVGEDGERYGVIRDMFAPQDEINARRRRGVALLNERQTMGVKGAVDVARLKSALRNPKGHVEIDEAVAELAGQAGIKPFEIIPTSDMAAGNLQMLQEAKSEIDLMGANSGLAGKDGGEQSGRAIMAKQQGGLIEIAPLTERLSDFTRRVYRQIWLRIRQYWREETWVRVTDDERNMRFVGLNKPVTLLDRLRELPPEQASAFVQANGIMPGDPRLQAVLDVENPVEEIDVDILIEEVPDQVTLESETFEKIVDIATSVPGVIPPDVLFELAPGLKRDVKDRLIEGFKEQQAAQAQQGQMQAQIAQQSEGAKIAKDMATAMKAEADAQQTAAQTVRTNIETQRMAVYGF